jgi:hypothetical protein
MPDQMERDPLARLEARAAEARAMVERARARIAVSDAAIARARVTVPHTLEASRQLRELARKVREGQRRPSR